MPRRDLHRPAEPADKRALLQCVYALQGRKLRAAERKGDRAAALAILRRCGHVEGLLADLEQRGEW